MTHKITLELTDVEYETLVHYVKEDHEDMAIEEYLTNKMSFYLRIGSYKAVCCPYGCEESVIKPIRITSTLLDWSPGDPDQNIYSTEYICGKCKKRFWVRRRLGKKDEYVSQSRKEKKRLRERHPQLLKDLGLEEEEEEEE